NYRTPDAAFRVAANTECYSHVVPGRGTRIPDGARSAGRTVRPGTRAAAGKREEPGGCLSSRRTLAAPVRSLRIAPGARRPGSLLLLSRPQRLRPHRRCAAEVAST